MAWKETQIYPEKKTPKKLLLPKQWNTKIDRSKSSWQEKKKVPLLIIGGIQHKILCKALVFLIKTYLVRKTYSTEITLILTEITKSAIFTYIN